MKKTTFFIISCLMLVSFILVKDALALGLTTQPIVIKNALRSNEYQESLTIINNDETQAKIVFATQGSILDEAEFYLPEDLINPIESVEIDAGQNKKVIVVIKVPSDTANGEYKGLMSVIKKPGELETKEGEISLSVEQKIDRRVTIIVGGEEEVGLQVSVIPKTYDVKRGRTLEVRFIFDNLGNVSLRPQMDVKIKDIDGKIVYNAIYPYPEDELSVRPNAQYEIPAIVLPTNNFENGRYFVEIDFLHNNSVIFEKGFRFSVGSGGIIAGLRTMNLGIFWPIVALVVILALIVMAILRTKKIIKNKKESSI